MTVCLDSPDWVHSRYNEPLSSSCFKLEELRSYAQAAHRFCVPVTFNIDVDGNGEFLPETLQLLRRLKAQVVWVRFGPSRRLPAIRGKQATQRSRGLSSTFRIQISAPSD